MSFIEITGMDEVQEPQLAPEGQYDLRITYAQDYVNDKGTPLVRCSIAFDGHPEYANMNYWIVLPQEDLDQDANTKRILAVKRFLVLFNVPFENGFNVEDLLGATGTAFVAQSEADEDGNIYNELRVPKID